jgi:2,3-bisphosphoglycerate-dependent phosphoglycerate mutase
MATELVLLRHGESSGNALGMFTGGLDVELTQAGQRQSVRAGELLRDFGVEVDLVLCSPLTRARETARIVLAALPVQTESIVEWRLSERSYGALTGRSKVEVLRQVGEQTFLAVRRSLDVAPAPLSEDELARLRAQPAFAGCPTDAAAATESLRDVIERVRPLLEDVIVPHLRAGRSLLVIAHGNSLRALAALLDGLDEAQLWALNLPPGQPLRYRVASDGTPVAGSGQYLDPVSALQAAEILAREGGT